MLDVKKDPYICKSKKNKLCENSNCDKCYNRSFKSHPKSIFLCKKKNIITNSRNIIKGTHKKYWFTCNKCNHYFNTSIVNIVKNNSWCPYCANKKLCDDDKCTICFNKSFSSYRNKNIILSSNNNISSRKIFLQSNKTCLFYCIVCSHEFKSKVSNIVNKNICSFCSNKKLCNNINCTLCFNKSFASCIKCFEPGVLITDCWDKKNKKKPREIFKKSSKKYWFYYYNKSFQLRIDTINKSNKKIYNIKKIKDNS